MSLVRLHQRKDKVQKNKKNDQEFAKTEIIEAIKTIGYYPNIMFFLFQALIIIIQLEYTKIINFHLCLI